MNDDRNRVRLPVTMTLTDGRELIGDVIVNIGGTLERTLNSETRFLLFGDLDRSERMIAKNAILDIAERKTAKIVKLPTEGKVDDTDPYTLLKISQTATDQEIRDAYLTRARSYHPDKFANIELPPEVAAYTNAMSRRINEAYAVLTARSQKKAGGGFG